MFVLTFTSNIVRKVKHQIVISDEKKYDKKRLDLRIEIQPDNLLRLEKALIALSCSSTSGKQEMEELTRKNISLKHKDFFNIELTAYWSNFFKCEDAGNRCENKSILGLLVKTISLDDLPDLKIRSGRNKDLLEVKELIHSRNGNTD